MSSRNLLLFFVAALFAVGTVLFVRSHSQAPTPVAAAPAPKADRVLTARHDIPPGSFVKSAADLEWTEWPAAGIQPTYIREGNEDIKNFEGAVARQTIHTGEAITSGTLIKPGSGGFLSAVLEPGMRAVSVAVSATSGAAGFIFPGDRVDIIVTSHVKRKDSPNAAEHEEVVSETFIQNVRVVAVDQMLDNPDNKAIMAKTVTVEVTTSQAQAISVAEDLGKISFSLRSLAAEAPPQAVADKTDKADEKTTEGGEGGPLIPVDSNTDQDLVSELAHAQGGQQPRNYTRESDISPRFRSVLVVRGDQSEQHEFFLDNKNGEGDTQ